MGNAGCVDYGAAFGCLGGRAGSTRCRGVAEIRGDERRVHEGIARARADHRLDGRLSHLRRPENRQDDRARYRARRHEPRIHGEAARLLRALARALSHRDAARVAFAAGRGRMAAHRRSDRPQPPRIRQDPELSPQSDGAGRVDRQRALPAAHAELRAAQRPRRPRPFARRADSAPARSGEGVSQRRRPDLRQNRHQRK